MAIIESSVKLQKLHLALAKSIVTPYRNRSVCKVMNPRNVAKFLKPLDVIQKLHLDSVTVIDDDDLSSSEYEVAEIDSEVPLAKQLEMIADKGIKLQQNSLTTAEFHKMINLLFYEYGLIRRRYARFGRYRC